MLTSNINNKLKAKCHTAWLSFDSPISIFFVHSNYAERYIPCIHESITESILSKKQQVETATEFEREMASRISCVHGVLIRSLRRRKNKMRQKLADISIRFVCLQIQFSGFYSATR